MYRFLCFIAMVAAACAAGATTAQIPVANDAHPSGYLTEQYFLVDGIQLSDAEATQLVGGDVRMDLDDMRTRLTVRVTDNEYEARLGRIPPIELYTIDVHNRVADTIGAPFYPADRALNALRNAYSYSSKPEPFPAGAWNITTIKQRNDQYGPYMIGTDAVQLVNVYKDGKNLGEFWDTGYSLHANTKPMSQSVSYGCIVMSRDDDRRLAGSLAADRQRNRTTNQLLVVRDLPGRD